MPSSVNNNNQQDLFDYLRQVGLGGVAGGSQQAGRGRGRSANNGLGDGDFQDVIDVEVTEEERLYTDADRNRRRSNSDEAESVGQDQEGAVLGGVVPLGRSFGAFTGTYDAGANTGDRRSGFAGNVFPPSPSAESAVSAYLGNTVEGLAAPFENRLDVVA